MFTRDSEHIETEKGMDFEKLLDDYEDKFEERLMTEYPEQISNETEREACRQSRQKLLDYVASLQPKWIPVSERFPVEGNTYIVVRKIKYHGDPSRNEVHLAFWHNEKWLDPGSGGNGWPLNEITHRQFLPKPPENKS